MIYVISDLHGYSFEKFKKILEKANFSDEDFLFVLGDVIDRGKDGVEYLKWLSLQPNCQLILGNHEAMLLSCSFLFDEINEKSIDNLSEEKFRLLSVWQSNGAIPTLEKMKDLEPDKRQYLIEYLQDAPLYETVSTGDKDFLLTHSGINNFDITKKITDYTPHDFLWNRPKMSDEYFADVITVFGHTPTFLYSPEYAGKVLKTKTWIDIDVGTGYGHTPILLRLDDMKEFTI